MIDGRMIVAGEARYGDNKFHGTDAATGQIARQGFSEASLEDVADAAEAAAAAAPAIAALSLEQRAAFLEACANAIEAIGDPLITTAMVETGLPQARLEGERGRTVGQLRLFASEVRRGDWLDVTIDQALPDRVPPRADLRRMNVPLGPVAVFGASNFPLAFSVAGGDSASAWAAGCPVIVKGHPAHPSTGELVARAIAAAAASCGVPPAIFSYLPGRTHAVGTALVADSRIKAVAFTGSRQGGLALAAVAAARAEPIPVYAEMSSVNPVFLLPDALATRAEALATGFIGSLTLGAGQFCTNPGLVIGLAGADFDRFAAAASDALAGVTPSPMLTPDIARHFADGVAAMAAQAGVTMIGASAAAAGSLPTSRSAALFVTRAAQFIENAALQAEMFGAAALLIACDDIAEMQALIGALEGQLTATIHFNADDATDAALAAQLLGPLANRAGRLLANGWPTGVEVAPAMVHGGPWPATSDSRTTSVGTLAMTRFLRPVCYQDFPPALLPAAVQPGNPWQVRQRLS